MKDIIGYEGYYKIDEYGEVYALRYKEPKKICPFRKNGHKGLKTYKRISLSMKCKSKKFSVHRLVAEAYIGKIPEDYTVNHIDGNKINNHYSNLEIVTRAYNELHAINNGLKSGAIGRKYSNNVSGYVGVSPMQGSNMWKAQLRYKKELIYLGIYKTPEEASEVYQTKFQELYGGEYESIDKFKKTRKQ